jgi:hypothetical protein
VSSPHPLTRRLIERLQWRPANPILDFAAGSGRNGEALRRAGFSVISVADDVAASTSPLAGVADPVSAALSTHGLLHGTPCAIAARVRAIGDCLEPGGLLYATFGSIRDARFGCGERIDDATYAPLDGDERGVAHTYFDGARLRALLEDGFVIESLDECGVDGIAGSWAHRERPLAGAVHWFAQVRKP